MPDWVKYGVFWHVYPLGFCGADIRPAGPRQFHGRGLDAIIPWLEYVRDLGASGLLLGPVFESATHGYDTLDHMHIDVRLGGDAAFDQLVAACRDMGLQVMLDGVFNHAGRGFWAFKDVQEKKWDSPYKDWFCINFDGNSCYNDGFWYEGWEGHFELVKLNLANSAVVDYLLECVKGWIDEFDIDGLRLDVAYCLDRNFMKRLRSFCQELKPDFALIGEVLFGDYNQIVNDEMLHSCTNYECYKGIYSSFNSMNMFEIAHSLNRQYGPEQWCIYRGKHLMSFVDNHDVTRIASILTNKNHLPLTYGLLLGMPGVPCIYYGSEWGEEGVKAPNNDYALRPCFEEPKPNELTEEIKKMIHVRTGSNALCHGSYRNVVLTNHQLIFERRTDDERMLVAINASDAPFTAHNGELGGTMTDLLTGNEIQMSGQLEMPPYSVQYLK